MGVHLTELRISQYHFCLFIKQSSQRAKQPSNLHSNNEAHSIDCGNKTALKMTLSSENKQLFKAIGAWFSGESRRQMKFPVETTWMRIFVVISVFISTWLIWSFADRMKGLWMPSSNCSAWRKPRRGSEPSRVETEYFTLIQPLRHGQLTGRLVPV
jgi:hypothetical protein